MGDILYQPLKTGQIRLLKFHPGEIEDRIYCEMRNISLDNKPDYFALSYVWGTILNHTKISLNGHELEIGKNLYIAINHLRTHEERFTSHFVWIDALCINQKDNAEKAQQVGQMDDIYSHAQTTIAWLGVPQPADEHYYEILFDILSQGPRSCYGYSLSELIVPRILLMTQEELQDPRKEVFLGAKRCIEQLLVNPWFDRCSYSDLYKAPPATLNRSDYLHVFTRMHALEQLSDWATKRGLGFGRPGPEANEIVAGDQLLELLDSTARRHCTIPHDTIYGVLGLWHHVRRQELPQELTPNYDIPYADVCQQYSAYLLAHTRDLRIITKRTPTFNTKVPSWVPDLGCIDMRADGHQIFHTKRAQVRISPNGQELLLKGRHFASVIDGIASFTQLRGPHTSGSIFWNLITQRITEFENMILKPAMQYKGITVEAGRSQFLALTDCMNSYDLLRNHDMELSSSGQGFDIPSEELEDITGILNKTMILMDSGHVLFADGEAVYAKPGDQVIVCEGDNFQFLILRPSDMGQQLIQTGRYDISSFGFGFGEYIANKVVEEFTIV
ncbi:unnamed protein product [Penicillium bialowiezense]